MGSDVLSSPVQLPCVWVHTTEWANKTVSNTRLKHIHTPSASLSFMTLPHTTMSTTLYL